MAKRMKRIQKRWRNTAMKDKIIAILALVIGLAAYMALQVAIMLGDWVRW